MRYTVAFDRWDPFMGSSKRETVTVEADTGDEAVHRGKIAAFEVGSGGIKIVGVYPAEDQAPPAAVAEGDDPPDDPDEKDGLIAEAEARGVKIDKRWGVARLRAALEAA